MSIELKHTALKECKEKRGKRIFIEIVNFFVCLFAAGIKVVIVRVAHIHSDVVHPPYKSVGTKRTIFIIFHDTKVICCTHKQTHRQSQSTNAINGLAENHQTDDINYTYYYFTHQHVSSRTTRKTKQSNCECNFTSIEFWMNGKHMMIDSDADERNVKWIELSRNRNRNTQIHVSHTKQTNRLTFTFTMFCGRKLEIVVNKLNFDLKFSRFRRLNITIYVNALLSLLLLKTIVVRVI